MGLASPHLDCVHSRRNGPQIAQQTPALKIGKHGFNVVIPMPTTVSCSHSPPALGWSKVLITASHGVEVEKSPDGIVAVSLCTYSGGDVYLSMRADFAELTSHGTGGRALSLGFDRHHYYFDPRALSMNCPWLLNPRKPETSAPSVYGSQ